MTKSRHETSIKARYAFKLTSAQFVWINAVLWGGGILVGLAAVLMTYLTDRGTAFFESFIRHPWYLPLVTTPFIMMFTALLTRLLFPRASGGGIHNLIAGLVDKKNQKSYLGLKVILGKYLLIIPLMFGASIGREGPIAQIGAGIMRLLNPLVSRFDYDFRPALIIAGGAAGVGAAFSAPLAGIVFALESLSRRIETRIGSIILVTVALSSIVGYLLLGNYAFFGTARGTEIITPEGWLAVIVASILAGLLGGVFTVTFIKFRQLFIRVSLFKIALIGLIAGFIIVGLGFLSHGLTYGTGYHETSQIIAGEQLPASYPFYKMLSTLFSGACGIPGGIFSPVLSAGAGLGQIFSHWFPGVEPNALVIIAMTAFFCGVTRTPITSFALVMQIEHVPGMSAPLIAAALLANIFSSLIAKKPFYDTLAEMVVGQHRV